MTWPKNLNAAGIIESLKRKISSLQERWRRTRRENEQLRKENEELREEQQRLYQERERLREELNKLKRQLEEAQRAHKRQAAPFSRGRRKANPKPPGRKSGEAYGRRHSKAIPEHVDEVISVPLPPHCDCGGALELEKVESQYQHAKRFGGASILPSVAAANGASACKGEIPGRLRMRWEPPPCNWVRRPWRWPSR
jgi:uncharacterized protein YhaN